MQETLLTAQDIGRIFHLGGESIHALSGINLRLQIGEIVLIAGKSGSGKTTLLNLMGGLDVPTNGRIIYRGADLAQRSERELARWRRSTIGFIFQSFALIEGLTALENVEIAARIGGMAPRIATEESHEILGMLGMAKRAHHRIAELSGGEQQRVALARGLVCRRELVLADEPTGELDHAMSRSVLDILKKIVEEREMTICLTSHDPAVLNFADRAYHLQDGKLVEERTS
jgi:putative ABC transport system ATP-binding protein